MKRSIGFLIVLAALSPSSDALFGGKEVDSDSNNFNFTVKIDGPKGTCTGSLVHPLWILTAAHCLPDSGNESLKVTHGSTHTHPTPNEVLSVRFSEKFEIFSPENETDENIGLIKLSEPINSHTVQLSSLHRSPGHILFTAGFGQNVDHANQHPAGLTKAMITVSSESLCDFFSMSNTSITSTGCFYDEDKFYTTGDTGGPVILDNEFQFQQVAVNGDVNFDPVTWEINPPATFTYISVACDWIAEETEGDVKCVD